MKFQGASCYNGRMSKPEHICGRDCDYDADRGCPMEAAGPEDGPELEEDLPYTEDHIGDAEAPYYEGDADFDEYPDW